MINSEQFGNGICMRIRCFSDVGPRRGQNQDNFYIDGQINRLSQPTAQAEAEKNVQIPFVLGLFDGMGGESSGEQASLAAASCMEQMEAALTADRFTEEALSQATERYYQRFLDTLEEVLDNDYISCGTTCVAAVFNGLRMRPFWMGDSRLYLLRDGVLTQLTRDDSVAQKQIDQGITTEKAARKTAAWHTLTSYMGQFGAVFSLGDEVTLHPGDRLLFCSDGITDTCLDDELLTILQMDGDIAIAAFQEIAANRSDDNSTVILVDVQDHSLTGKYNELTRRMAQWLQSKWKDRN